MPTRDQVRERLEAGASFEEVGRTLGIPAGQAYMIATGAAADGSDAFSPEELDRRLGALDGSTQHLANPRVEEPADDPRVAQWRRQRARSDRTLQEAARAHPLEPPPIVGEGTTTDVLSVLGWGQNQVKVLSEKLQAIKGVRKGGRDIDLERRARLVDMIRERESVSSKAQQQAFWPAVRDALPDGDALADEGLRRGEQVSEVLMRLAVLRPDEDDFDEQVEALVLALRRSSALHATVALGLREHMSTSDREQVGRRVQQAEEEARS